MLFSSELPQPALIELSRALRHNLAAGLSIVRVFRQQAQRGMPPVRPVADRIADELEGGESLEAALKGQQARFPPLFLSLASVGERTGHLPEIFGELEKYYALQQRLWRQFVGQITWPAIQFFAAIFVIAFLIFVLGIIAQGNGSQPLDVLGWGLVGNKGAIRFLLYAFGSLAVIYLIYKILFRSLSHRIRFDEVVLRLPAIGPCVLAFAMMRFCIALRLTMETGMPIAGALRLSLKATGNAAFASRAENVVGRIRTGQDLTRALTATHLFTEEFENIMAVAEESGRIPEVMRQRAEAYEEEAGRRMRTLTQVAGFAVYAFVALLIIWAIFRIFTQAMNAAMPPDSFGMFLIFPLGVRMP